VTKLPLLPVTSCGFCLTERRGGALVSLANLHEDHKRFRDFLLHEIRSDPSYAPLIRNLPGKNYRKPVFDLGIYTRNRVFRLPLNTKVHQSRYLRPDGPTADWDVCEYTVTWDLRHNGTPVSLERIADMQLPNCRARGAAQANNRAPRETHDLAERRR
jgi:hypothetical protein